ncbi:MAG: styrene monooxygenase/indole monooxygenase family protein [Pseudomonadota bacterium]|nr:styrene monooxygenase/indole monooxygenase family protein [Pseudomonadota bacterium]
MRRIAIIGSGQAGLLAAHALAQRGYTVTLYTDRSPQEWLERCRPTGTAGRFEPALAWERELGVDHWQSDAASIEGVHLTFCLAPPNRLLTLAGKLAHPGKAIDLRLQSHRWLTDLPAAGAEVVHESVTVERLDAIAAQNDLTVVAAGRADLCNLFPRDAARSVYDKPQRKLAMIITKGGAMGFGGVPFVPVKFNLFAPWGEVFWVPYHHRDHGPTWNMLFEAREGGPLDRFGGARSAEETLKIGKEVIRECVPWDYEWARDMEVADPNGWLVGAVTPTVRAPVGRLPSGRVVTPLGDTAVSMDPIAGQGANSGNKMAKNLVERIVAHGDRPFDAAWMTDTFEAYWARHGSPTTRFNNLFLEPLPDAGKQVLVAQYGSNGVRTDAPQKIADAFCANFEDPARCTDIIDDTGKARAFIGEHTGSHWLLGVLRGAMGVGREQIRQQLGGQPRHPLAGMTGRV